MSLLIDIFYLKNILGETYIKPTNSKIFFFKLTIIKNIQQKYLFELWLQKKDDNS